MQKGSPQHFVTVLIGKESTDQMTNFLDVAQQLTLNLCPEEYNEIDWKPAYGLHGVNARDCIVINKSRGLVCHVVHCDHRIPCVGYCFSQTKQELCDKFKGLPGPEIGKLPKQ